MSNESFELSAEETAALLKAYGESLLSDEQLDEVSGGAVAAKIVGPTIDHTLTCSLCGTQFTITLPRNEIPPTMCHDCAWRYYQTHSIPMGNH